MANQPIKFEVQPSGCLQCLMPNGDIVTGVEQVSCNMEAKGGPFVTVRFKIDGGTMQTADN